MSTSTPDRIQVQILAFLVFGLLGLGLAPSAEAQSCVLTRLDSPILNAIDPTFDPLAQNQRWEASFSWRYGRSFRHFVGTDEQEERVREGSEVINSVHLADFSLRYAINARTSISVGVPYLMARRSGPLRNEEGELIGRVVRSNTRGISDISVVVNRLLWDPALHPRWNVVLGVGVKLPTGANSLTDTRLRFVDGRLVPVVETADQSVQPGDGGFGLIVQASGYRVFNASESLAGYFTGTYIVAPEGDSGVYTYRTAPGEEFMSIADQYVARLGLQLSPESWQGWSVGLGGRLEGIPVHDLIGSSEGFRRPGYMLSAEPSLTWTRGVNTVTLAVPVAVERNRQRSVPDLRRGAHGDAAFPDYLVIASYSRRF